MKIRKERNNIEEGPLNCYTCVYNIYTYICTKTFSVCIGGIENN